MASFNEIPGCCYKNGNSHTGVPDSSCTNLITQAFVPIVGVLEEDQATVAGKAAFSGEVERVSEVIEQVHGLICPLETAPHSFAERAAFSFVTYDVPDGFPGAG